VILSLLQAEGLPREAFRVRFATDVLEALPELRELESRGYLEITGERLRLTASGLERSDTIGPWLFSERVRGLMESYTWRME
jgi:oxygen-independent coproporphyrinogen-3 oxidase